MSNQKLIGGLTTLPRLVIQPRSLVIGANVEYGLTHEDGQQRLAMLAPSGSPHFTGFEGTCSEHHGGSLVLGPLSAPNAATLRTRLPWLRPRTFGLRTSVGLGDRLGFATPGHVQAVRAAGGNLAPMFAQQSIREMQRTGRSPQEVMDDVMWGIFAEGWCNGNGADADHLKTPADIDTCVAAGYTFYTFDPGEHVYWQADSMSAAELRSALNLLPWHELNDSPEALAKRYLDKSFDLEGNVIHFDEVTLLRSAIKYGRAIAHAVALYRHLVDVARDRDVEVEISVDETETPTTHAQHVYIANELKRLEVQWVSLAPRYVGRFEKGVDYIGDVGEFEADFAIHAAIARFFGPYKLSLHSGSDKFSIYEAAVRQTRGLIHLKTAGTSYLEALHTIAALDPTFFRAIYAFARQHYAADRASYVVSASLDQAPDPVAVSDADLPTLLADFDAREILHVTFGSVLRARDDGRLRFANHLKDLLGAHPEAYAANLRTHFQMHLAAFAAATKS